MEYGITLNKCVVIQRFEYRRKNENSRGNKEETKRNK